MSSVIGLAGDPARPVSVLIDTVKSRVLRFALEIREALAAVDDEPGKLPTAKIDAAVNTFIIGGNNVINSQVAQLSQQGNTTIVQGDFGAPAKALEALGIAESDIADLKRATDEDAAQPESGLGKKTSSWLSKLAAKMGGAGWTVGTAADVEIVTQLIFEIPRRVGNFSQCLRTAERSRRPNHLGGVGT